MSLPELELFVFLALIVFLAFVGFVIYFIFKILEFVIRAIRLYVRMISRLDMIIKLLAEMRGGPPVVIPDDEDIGIEELMGTAVGKIRCSGCGAVSERGSRFCEQCGQSLRAN